MTSIDLALLNCMNFGEYLLEIHNLSSKVEASPIFLGQTYTICMELGYETIFISKYNWNVNIEDEFEMIQTNNIAISLMDKEEYEYHITMITPEKSNIHKIYLIKSKDNANIDMKQSNINMKSANWITSIMHNANILNPDKMNRSNLLAHKNIAFNRNLINTKFEIIEGIDIEYKLSTRNNP